MNSITPQNILEFIKFNAEDDSWRYDENKKDMYAYQAEGSAGIINRLNNFGLAILSDEVGMGKTFQALAVVAKQFQEKPDSKVLIITPRYEVLRQWKDEEYREFKEKHLVDSTLLPSLDELGELSNFYNGFLSINKNTIQSKIIFAKTTSFQLNTNIAKCKQDIKKFDLIIIDEAHKFRTSKKSVNRNKNATEIFKDASSKILLMTATPLHSKKSDIVNIVNVFKSKLLYNIEATPESIMDNLMIRRLRVMSNNYNKYHYREEKELKVDISSKEDDYKDELFFAMLQKKMIQNKGVKVDYSKSKNMLDLLEGTSFDEKYNQENQYDVLEQLNLKNKEIKSIQKTFNYVVDKFKTSYKKQLPSNQKYNSVITQIEQDNEKALVFVRRRASAIELSRQYIEKFDKKAWSILSKNQQLPRGDNREEFDRLLGLNKINKNLDKITIKIEKVDSDNIFTKEYKKYINSTRQFKSIRNIMASHFLELYDSIDDFNVNLIEFKEKIKNINSKTSKKEIKDVGKHLPKSIILSFFKRNKGEISTSASRFVRKFDKGKQYEKFFIEWLPKKLDYLNQASKNHLIKSAVLHASIGMVELFKCDIKAKNYESFCKEVEKNLDNFSFPKEIKEFLDNFDKYKKYLEVNNNTQNKTDEKIDEKLDSYNENIFYNAQPAYAYLSNTKNKTVIARFNSPFFPYLLCGTSTLQEGLNLHLQCNKVYHFGSAHTMGDDEQRIGRVDRIHGKMYRELQSNSDSKLHIYYPYLKNTFDEENLRNMLCNKRATEKNIDRCKIATNSSNTNKVLTANQCEKPIEELIYLNNKNNTIEYGEPFGWKILKN